MRTQVLPILILGFSLLSGCGGSGGANELDTYKVSGTVTFQNTPLGDAQITFSPLQDGIPAAIGRTDSSGNYMLTTYNVNDGAAEGDFKVLISKYVSEADAGEEEEEGHSDDPNAEFDAGHEGAAGQGKNSGNLVPGRYAAKEASPFSATVKADGENRFDFDMQ